MIESRTEPQQSSNSMKNVSQAMLLFAGLFSFFALLVTTQVLVIPLLLSVTLYFILNPFVNAIERSGFSRTWGALFVSLAFYAPSAIVLYYGVNLFYKELATLQTAIPEYVAYAQNRLQEIELSMVKKFSFLEGANLSQWLFTQLSELSDAFLSHSPEILNTFAWATVLLPILTFFFLRDAIAIRNILLDLTPNRYFEKAFSVANQIEKKIGYFIVAKLLEATLVGLLTLGSLLALNFPYPVLFSFIAGATNIIPYFGPILGFAPILATPFFVPEYQHLFYPALIASTAVNVLDMIVIFPLLVSRVIDLHPLVVLLSLVVGGNIAGPVGLLVAIPAAAIIKIFAYELLSISPRLNRN